MQDKKLINVGGATAKKKWCVFYGIPRGLPLPTY